MGEIPNEYFSSVFTVEKNMDVRELEEINSDVLRSVHITEKEVLEVLKRIKGDKFPGPDEVYPRTLWEAMEEIAGPLAEIFESSIVTVRCLKIGEWQMLCLCLKRAAGKRLGTTGQ